MVGGTVSTAAEDAAVMLVLPEMICTGSLIAPNLVLTARHCVSRAGKTECSPFGEPMNPGKISVRRGVSAAPEQPELALGKRITVPTTSNMCSFDVALLELDRSLEGPLAPLRFSALQEGEAATAVGYGVDETDQPLAQRMQRTTTVLGVGPKPLAYTTQEQRAVNYDIPVGDVATGEATCYGDSGGPLFDARGRVIGITSRGVDEHVPEGGNHGNGCLDLPSIFSGVQAHEQLIRRAAEAAGHPLPAGDTPAVLAAPDPRAAGDEGEDSEDEEDDEKDDRRARSKSTEVQPSGGCATTPPARAPGSSPSLYGVAGAIALALAVARRRRRLPGFTEDRTRSWCWSKGSLAPGWPGGPRSSARARR
jgi:MYXO-CTERM domain-containing protein